jgi:hypothetical protein
VNSINALAKSRFGEFGGATVVSLIVAGYMALAGSAFWMFTNRSDGSNADSTRRAAPTLMCECHDEAQAIRATN